MKNKVSKYHTATFFFCSMFAIITSLSIETFTLPSTSTGGIGHYVSFLTLSCLSLLYLKNKDFKQNKGITIELTSVNLKKHP